MVGRLLKQSILTMCKEAVHYDSMLEIDGLICVATDNGQRQVVIKIHEIFHKLPRRTHGSLRLAGDEKSFVVKHDSKKPNVSCIDSVHCRGLVQKKDLEDSDTNGDEETSSPTSRDIGTAGFPGNIDNEMHTLAIYKVYKDSKTIETKQDGSVSDVTVNVHETENKPSLGPARLQESGSSQTSLSEDFDQNSDQKAPSSSNGVERHPNLQASTLTNISCKKCNEVLENGAAYEAHNTNVHSVYTCFVCLNTFTSRNNMTRHIRIHSGTKPYSCPRCPERFTRKDDVKRHILRHDFNKPFRCASCNMGYTEKTTMKVHFERDHGSNIFFSCSQCGKCYSKENDFQFHMKTHPEFRQFSCNVCIFTGSSSLMYQKHMLVHEKGKTYICSHCNDMKFKDPFIYTSHLKSHRSDHLVKSFRCCFCDVSLTSYDQFVRHEHTHVQARRYACKICFKVFEWPGHLQDHMLTHDQEHGQTPSTVASEIDMPERHDDSFSPKCDENLNEVKGSVDYWCAECSLGFASEHSLEKHILETHEIMNNSSLAQRLNDVEKAYKFIPKKMDDGLNAREIHVDLARPVDDGKQLYQDTEKSIDVNERTQTSEAEPIVSIDGDKYGSYRFENREQYSEEAEDLSMKRREHDKSVEMPMNYNSGNLAHNKQSDITGDDSIKQNPHANSLMALGDSHRKDDIRSLQRLFHGLSSVKKKENIPRSTTEEHDVGTRNMPRMSILRNESQTNNETNESPKSKLPKLYNLIFGQSPTEDSRVIKTEPGESLSDTNHATQTNQYSKIASQNAQRDNNVQHSEGYPVIKKIKIEKLDDFGPSEAPRQTDIESITVSSIPKPNFLGIYPLPISASSAVGTDQEPSPANSRPVSPSNSTHSSTIPQATTSVKLKTRGPGFEKVVTPDVLFRAKAPFTCEDCNGVFNDFTSFDHHGIHVHHSYVCEYCGKVFTAKPNRERHVRYHTGEKPYRCELCAESYFRGDDLKYHRTAKHGDIRPYVCKGCARSFIWKKDLEKHVRRYPDHK